MNLTLNQRKFIIVAISLLFLIVVAVVVFIAVTSPSKVHTSIRIQNYETYVKNIPEAMRSDLETYLYTITSMNSTGEINGDTIKDAYIRDGSATQSFSNTEGYTGNFIVDIKSIGQSYEGGYHYFPPDPNSIGQPVYFTCVPNNELLYEPFNCQQIFADQDTELDPIIQYLPYKTLSYSIRADARDKNNLIINVELLIPDSYLRGSSATRKSAVAAYKNEVTQWITSKGLEPSDYTIHYNYDDAGKVIK